MVRELEGQKPRDLLLEVEEEEKASDITSPAKLESKAYSGFAATSELSCFLV